MQVTALGGSFDIDERLLDASPETVLERVEAYERGECANVDVPVSFPDSFTGRVMQAMAAIPAGETRTYGDIADELDSSPVAVGQACGRNPVPLVVPCHRVVGTGWVGGFSNQAEGDRVDLKRRLLEHESALPAGTQSTLADRF